MPKHNMLDFLNINGSGLGFDAYAFEQARLAKIEAENAAKREEEYRREQERIANLERQKREEQTRLAKLEEEKKTQKQLLDNTKEIFNKYSSLVCNSSDEEQLAIFNQIQIQIKNTSSLTSISELQALKAQIQEECQREEMMQKLESIFTKGVEFYAQGQEKDPFDLNIINEVNPNSSSSFKSTLRQMSATYLKNSNNIEPAVIAFDNISTRFFEEAAKSIKEIYALKTDTTQKWLERIPKLGLIAKTLRVGEQIRLTKCLLKDYNSLTDKYLSQGIEPLINKYNVQYNKIKKFIEQNPIQAKINKNFTQEILNLVEHARANRLQSYNKQVYIYSKNGMNISNICHNIKKQGYIELATKALFTLAPLF